MPLHYDAPDDVLTDLFKQINGIVFPGGGTSLKNVSSNRFYEAGKLLFDLAVKENQNNETFPIHGTCLGFQFLSILAAGDNSVLCGGCFEGTDGDPLPLEFTDAARRARLFSDMPDSLFRALSTENITENSHSSGVKPSAFETNKNLRDMFEILSTNTDANGLRFVSTMESNVLPFTGTQWHPEKSQFEWGSIGSLGEKAIPHSADAIAVSQYLANDFVARARLSSHRFQSTSAEKAALIYNDVAHLQDDPAGYFEQIYLWKSGYFSGSTH